MHKALLYYIMPIFKLAAFLICLIVCALPVGLFQLIPVIDNLNDEYSTVLIGSLLMISIFGALFMMTKIYELSTIKSFFISRKAALKDFLKGTVFGVVILAICAGLLVLTGNVSFSLGKISLAIFLFYILYFLVVALFEELFSRTYILFVFAESYPIAIAVLINGVLFGLLHAFNPGFTWLAMLNITLAGVLFSIFTLYYRSISWAVGIHLGWNFAQGILFGYKVSGNDSPGLLIANPIGENYFSGGVFGVEGSLICTIVLFVIITYFAIRYKIAPIKEITNS